MELSIRGPEQQYTNLPSKYEITLVNKGKGKATNVMVSTQLPKQLQPLKASEPNAMGANRIVWLLPGQLEPGGRHVFHLTLQAKEKANSASKPTRRPIKDRASTRNSAPSSSASPPCGLR